MKNTCLLSFLLFFYATVVAQVSPIVSDSTVKAVRINTDSTQLVILSAEYTGLVNASPTITKSCVVAFIGCDESRTITSDFMNYFYSEYLKTSDSETAFHTARQYFFIKYPDSQITPILNCKK